MNTYKENHIVRYSQADRNGRLKLRSLFDCFQDIAGEHAALLNLSVEQLHEDDKAWMLSRIKVKINRLPKIKEELELLTYPRGFDRFFARREFRLYDKSGSLLSAASSLWLFLQVSDLKILDAEKHLNKYMPDNSALDCAFAKLDKIIPKDLDFFQEYKIGESKLDINKHLNNAEYATFIQDYLGESCYPKELQINYQNAVALNEKVKISGWKEQNLFQLAGNLHDQVAFTAEGIMQ